MASCLYSLKSLGRESSRLFSFPNDSGWASKIIPLIAAGLIVWFGFSGSKEEQITISGSRMSWSITAVLFLLWGGIAFGYGIARMFRAQIVVDNEMSQIEEHASFRVSVGVIGYGKPAVLAKVVEVRNWRGEAIKSDTAPGVTVEWTYHEGLERMVIEEGSPKVTISLFSFPDKVAHIHGKHRIKIPGDNADCRDQWVKVRFEAEGCKPVCEWYGIRLAPTSALGYEPIPANQKPAFCI